MSAPVPSSFQRALKAFMQPHKGTLGMSLTYEQALEENPTISRAIALGECQKHGVDLEEFLVELGDHPTTKRQQCLGGLAINPAKSDRQAPSDPNLGVEHFQIEVISSCAAHALIVRCPLILT